MGEVGRAVLQWSLGWPEREPLSVVKPTNPVVRRDIDILAPYLAPDILEQGGLNDFEITDLIEVGKQPAIRLHHHRVPLTKDLLRPRMRRFAGQRVRTLAVGNHFMLELLFPTHPRPKDTAARARMARFAAWTLRTHPKEFLRPQGYAPYFDFAQKADIDLSLFPISSGSARA